MEPTQVQIVVHFDGVEADSRPVTLMQVPEILSVLLKMQDHLMRFYGVAMVVYLHPISPFEE